MYFTWTFHLPFSDCQALLMVDARKYPFLYFGTFFICCREYNNSLGDLLRWSNICKGFPFTSIFPISWKAVFYHGSHHAYHGPTYLQLVAKRFVYFFCGSFRTWSWKCYLCDGCRFSSLHTLRVSCETPYLMEYFAKNILRQVETQLLRVFVHKLKRKNQKYLCFKYVYQRRQK